MPDSADPEAAALELIADGNRVHRGTLDTAEGYIAERYRDGRRGRSAPPASWAPAIEAYMLTLPAAGRPAASMALRRIQVVRMTRELGLRPAEVTGEMLVSWFGSHTEWSIETRRSERAAVRSFWARAYKAGRVPHYLGDERGGPR